MDVKVTQDSAETRQEWVAPSFDRLPLNDAMGGLPHKLPAIADLTTLYSTP